MSENNESIRVGGYIAVFAIGALIGTGIALLYAPRSGRDTRALLGKKCNDIKNRASGAIADAKGLIEDKKSEIVAAFEAGKEAMREERVKHQKAA
jgi:gas vesicle protein